MFPLILYIRIKGEVVRGGMKSIGEKLGKWQKTQQGGLWDGVESKADRYFFSLGGCRIATSERLQHIEMAFRRAR